MSDAKSTEVKPPIILPPHYVLIAVVLMIASIWLTQSLLISEPWPKLGVLFAGFGVGIAAWAARQFSQAKTNIIPLSHSDALVVSGVFSHTRNPMYLGMISFLFGVALLANNWLALSVLPVFYFIIRHLFIAREEKLMLATFGDEYASYCKNVRRWI